MEYPDDLDDTFSYDYRDGLYQYDNDVTDIGFQESTLHSNLHLSPDIFSVIMMKIHGTWQVKPVFKVEKKLL